MTAEHGSRLHQSEFRAKALVPYENTCAACTLKKAPCSTPPTSHQTPMKAVCPWSPTASCSSHPSARVVYVLRNKISEIASLTACGMWDSEKARGASATGRSSMAYMDA